MTTLRHIVSAEVIARTIEPLLAECATVLRADIIDALIGARESERSSSAQRVLDQILDNARIAREKDLPLCQDTGSVWVLIELDRDVELSGDIQGELDREVAKVWNAQGLRAGIVADALVDRTNTTDNTPVFLEITPLMADVYSKYKPAIPGARVSVMLKGAGSDNASQVIMLSPAQTPAAIEAALIELVKDKGSMACPPLVIGVGVGSTFDKVASLSKKALLRTLDSEHPDPEIAALEAQLLDAVNNTGIGPAGLGGDTTALRVFINTAPAHIAALPVAINLGCSALRCRTVHIDGVEQQCVTLPLDCEASYGP
ncbi:MAG: fumarate hydratase [Coriobacteriia bacterium]|nr:fumarate hydratase [Coriobacteriia bacterium]